MKTVFKTYDTQQARAKQIEYEAQYGVKFDVYSTGTGMHITPIATRTTPTMAVEQAMPLVEFLPKSHLVGGIGFVALSERSGYSLVMTLVMAKTLAQAGLATPIVNRNGNFGGLNRRF